MLGPRETFIFTAQNRKLVRKWAVACGMPSTEVYRMTGAELANLYHAGTPTMSTVTPVVTFPAPTPFYNPAVPAAVTADASAQLAAMIQQIAALGHQPQPVAAPLDIEAVRAVVQEELASVEPREVLHKLEITSPAGVVIIPGAHYQTATVIKVVSLGHPVMLVGPAGCGKTTIGEHVATALQLPFYITSTVFDTHELMGFVDGHGAYHRTPFREAFENGGVWVADEIDAWDAAALLAANSALANGRATFPDSPVPVIRSPNFRMVATANTFGNGADRVYIGRNELDAASLDRFAVIPVDYDTTLETKFCAGNHRWLDRVWQVRKSVEEKRIRHVVSSRAIFMGATAIANGLEWEFVENTYLFKGMSETDRKKVG